MSKERRIDPADGTVATWEEFASFYKGKYKKWEIEEYWMNAKPAKSRRQAGGGGATSEKKGGKPHVGGQPIKIEKGCIVDMDPATEEEIARVPITKNIKEVVQAARHAQPAWAKKTVSERVELLGKALDALGAKEDLAATISKEMGKPMEHAMGEVCMIEDIKNSMAEYESAFADQVTAKDGMQNRVIRDPLGVVAVISPWNFPVVTALSMLLPALGSGNAVVFKPTEVNPLVGAMIYDAFKASLPDGVIQLVQGDGSTGAAVVKSNIDAVCFIGSSATGKAIMANGAPALKRLVLELGGKDPLIVFSDADLELAAQLAVDFSIMNTGQICTAYERVYVQKDVQEQFEALVLKAANAASGLGPLVSSRGRTLVQAHVDDAVKKGAKLQVGGSIPKGKGFFYPPTVLTNVPQKCRLMQEETFGPVISIATFSSEDEVVALANDSVYGLGATICTSDMNRADRVGRQLEVALVAINQWHAEEGPGAIAGGHRHSGYGLAFVGGDGLRQLTVPKSVLRKL